MRMLSVQLIYGTIGNDKKFQTNNLRFDRYPIFNILK
jgi:hypothetical protein